MLKRKVLYLFLVILVIQTVSSNRYLDYYFCDEQGNPINNVQLIGWRCDPKTTDECSSVNRNYQVTKDTQPISSGSDNFLRFEMAAAEDDWDYYIYYLYHPDFQAWKRPYRLSSWSGPLYHVDTYLCGDIESTLTKKDNCKADFSTSITSCAEAGLPLSILTDTNLDAETASAFGPYDYYWPPELDEWDRVNTRMYVDINPDGSPSSVTDFPKTDEAVIYGGETHNFNFLWQTSENTEPGDYVVTMRSTVPDDKCDQTNMQPVEQTFTVHIAPSLDGCVAQLQNFQVTSGDINEEVFFTGSHLNTYQNWSYESISACQAVDATLTDGRIFGASYTLTIEKDGNVIDTVTGVMQNNDDYNAPKAFEILWTPTEYGHYEATLRVQSSGSTSICNGEGTVATATSTFEIGNDNDGDGYYDLEGDCNDDNEYINPGAEEVCDGIDNDCDGAIDENNVCTQTAYFCDVDGDDLYSITQTGSCQGADCQPPGCQLEAGNDCDDSDSDISTTVIFYRDNDNDGYGTANIEQTTCPQFQPDDYVTNNLDCDDSNANINPDTEEICDGIDNDCDGETDEDLAETYYQDRDGDGYGNATFSRLLCEPETGFILDNNDCNDNSADANPAQEEICDNIDNDCDNTVDEECTCSEGEIFTCSNTGVCDGYMEECTSEGIIPECDFSHIVTYQTVETSCDGLDNDCDGSTDELSKCCTPPNTKTCKITCPTGEIQGQQSCQDYQWGACDAVCPEQEINIILPNQRTYYSESIEIRYTPEEECTYTLNGKTGIVNSGDRIEVQPGEYTLILQCGDKSAGTSFLVKELENNIQETEQKADLIDYFKVNQTQKEDAEKTNSTQKTSYGYEDGSTVIKNTIETDADSLDYYLELPKCMADHIDKVEFLDTGEYEIIQEDPQILWHFADVNDRVDLSYKVEGQIPEECLNQLRALPVGKYVKINEEQPSPIQRFVMPIAIISLLVSVVLYLEKHVPQSKLRTEEDYEKDFIEKERKQLLKNMKSMKFKTDKQANDYMTQLGLSEEMRDWLLKRLK